MNPYKEKVDEFPGRLFTFKDERGDAGALAKLCRGRQLIVEIGSGSGRNLLALAEHYPEVLCLGFEIRYKRAYRTIEKAIERGLENVFVLRTEGERLAELFAPRSVSSLFILFPDPWAKKRWRKHRILSKETLDRAAEVLEPDARLIVRTDHQEYFDSYQQTLSAHAGFHVNRSSRDYLSSEFADLFAETEFEALFRSQDLPIYYSEAKRTAVE